MNAGKSILRNLALILAVVLPGLAFSQTLEYGGSLKDGQHGTTDGLANAYSVAVSLNGQYVYVAAYADSAISVFKKSGDTLVYVHCLKNGQNGVVGLRGANSVTVSRDGQYVYVAALKDSALSVFKKRGDSLVYVTCLKNNSNGVHGLVGVQCVAVSPNGQYVYAASSSGPLAVFKKSGDSLLFVAHTGGGFFPKGSSVAVSPDGQYVYATSMYTSDIIGSVRGSVVVFKKSGDSLVYMHAVKDESGQALSGSNSVAVSPDGQFVYATSLIDGSLSILKMRNDTLVYVTYLRNGGPSGPKGLNQAISVTVSPDGQFVYVASGNENSVSIFKKSGDSLAYVALLKDGLNGVDGLAIARSVAASPAGQFVYAVSIGDDALSVFKKSGDSLVYITCIKDNRNGANDLGGASCAAVAPAGQFVYVTAAGDGALTVFKKNGDSLKYVASIKDGLTGVGDLSEATSVAVSPNGQFAYVTNINAVSVFRKSGDSLVFVHSLVDDRFVTPWIPSLLGASSVAVSPDGQFVYTAAYTDDALTVFKKSGDSLVYVHYLVKGRNGVNGLYGVRSVAVSPDGQFVYAAASGENAVSIFKKMGDSLVYVTYLTDGLNGVDGLTGARSVDVSPDGQFVYAAAFGEDAVTILKKSGDSLVYVACLKDGLNGVDGLDGANYVTVSPNGQFVYVAAAFDDAVSLFGKSGDSLVYIACFKDGQNGFDGLDSASCVTMSPDGQIVYVTAAGDNTISWFRFVAGGTGLANAVQKLNTGTPSIVPYTSGSQLWFAISTPGGEEFNIGIYDVAGRRLWQYNGSGGKAMIHVPMRGGTALPAGFYVSKLRTENHTAVERFLYVR